MEIRWLTAFIDLPAAAFDAGSRFWLAVTSSALSPARGAAGQFATLVPPDGDPYLRVQRLDGPGAVAGVHLDLHVADVPAAVVEATGMGAEVVHDDGYAVLRSPAGFTFCLVAHHGESARPRPRPEPAPHRIDQVCIDVPDSAFEAECAFWADLTGWRHSAGALDEFAVLDRPEGIPIRLLLQRLRSDDDRTTASAHLDIASGEHRADVARHHGRLGADVVGTWKYWTTLRDPAGLPYCLTARSPGHGRLPAAP